LVFNRDKTSMYMYGITENLEQQRFAS